jgi:hypothetical protein
MTEAEWLAATEPDQMLKFLRRNTRGEARKPRLYFVACCRMVEGASNLKH